MYRGIGNALSSKIGAAGLIQIFLHRTTTTEIDCYTQLTTRTEQAIQELMERSTKLSKPQRQRHTSMAHGALALWLRLVDGLSAASCPDHADRVQADHQRLKAQIRRAPAALGVALPTSVHAGRTPPTQHSYGLQWHRVQRAVRTIVAPSFGRRLDDAMDWHDFWEDVATSTFIHLHQLKDWFPEPVNGLATAYIDEHEPLQICADLANTAKHAWLDPDRGGARAGVVAGRGAPVITIPLGRPAAGPVSGANVEIRIKIERDGETSHLPAADLVRTCFQLWRQFIAMRVAAGELNNVEHGSVWVNENGRLRPRSDNEQ